MDLNGIMELNGIIPCNLIEVNGRPFFGLSSVHLIEFNRSPCCFISEQPKVWNCTAYIETKSRGYHTPIFPPPVPLPTRQVPQLRFKLFLLFHWIQ